MLSLEATVFPDLRSNTNNLFSIVDFYCDIDTFFTDWFKYSTLQQCLALFVEQLQSFKSIGSKINVILDENTAYMNIRGVNQMWIWGYWTTVIISKAVTKKEKEIVFLFVKNATELEALNLILLNRLELGFGWESYSRI